MDQTTQLILWFALTGAIIGLIAAFNRRMNDAKDRFAENQRALNETLEKVATKKAAALPPENHNRTITLED